MSIRALTELPARDLRDNVYQDLRLKNALLDTSSSLFHDVNEKLPIAAMETLGVGYATDRLIVVDLKTGERRVLPSRQEITKIFSGSTLRKHTWYKGIRGLNSGTADKITKSSGNTSIHSVASNGEAEWKGVTHYFNGESGSGSKMSEGWQKGSSAKFSLAYAGNGYFKSRKGSSKPQYVGFYQSASGSGGGADWNLKFDTAHELFKVTNPNDMGKSTTAGVTSRQWSTDEPDTDDWALMHYAYRCLTPSAYEYLTTNAEVLADLPKVLKELGYAFERIYKSDRVTFDARIQDGDTIRAGLGLTELAHALRTRRFSRNVYGESDNFTSGQTGDTIKRMQLNGLPISNGVINEHFMVMETSVDSIMIAPWWLVDHLDTVTFWDEDTELEMRDIERKDLMDAFNMLLKAASFEQGVNFTSHSHIPMMVFDDYKTGTLPDYTDRLSKSAALSATLLGYNKAWDAYQLQSNDHIGRLPYFPSIVSAKGTVIGKERAEFADRIAEASDQTIRVGDSTEFQRGQQLASTLSWSNTVMRTRFGEHSMQTEITPFGFLRMVETEAMDVYNTSLHTTDGGGNNLGDDVLLTIKAASIVAFAIDHWNALDKNTATQGYMPLGMNGMYFMRDYDNVIAYTEGGTAYGNVDDAHPLLWASKYWRPGRDNYLYQMMDSLETVYREWDNAADRIRTEGVENPTFSAIGLMAEFTYNTPSALVAANCGRLRRLMTVPAAMVDGDGDLTYAIGKDEPFYDAMVLGNNYHGSSINTSRTLFTLEPRYFFGSKGHGIHTRDGDLDLAPGVMIFSSDAIGSEGINWQALSQLRSWFMAHTSLLSEPVFDAYTAYEPTASWWTGGNDAGNFRTSGYGSNRIVFYQGEKDVHGKVRDLEVTPFAGVKDSTAYNYRAGKITAGDTSSLVSVYPVDDSIVGSNYESIGANAGNDYTMFLLSPNRIRTGESVVARSNLASITGDLSEDDFVPGRHYDKLWFKADLLDGTTPASRTFDEYTMDIDATLNSDEGHGGYAAQNVGIAYLETYTSSADNAADGGEAYRVRDWASATELNDHFGVDRAFPWNQRSVLHADGLSGWKLANAQFIEKVRASKEFQAANPVFVVFDKDYNDSKEAMLNMSLIMLGLSTPGPITYFGSMNADATAGPSTTIAGGPAFEVISLTMGSGAAVEEDTDDSDVDDDTAGDDNPDIEPEVVKEQVVN